MAPMGGFLNLRVPPDTIPQVLVVRDFVIGSGSGFSKIFVRDPGFVEKMTGGVEDPYNPPCKYSDRFGIQAISRTIFE